MASTITPTQTRINDPYDQSIFEFNTVDSKVYLSRESNKLLNIVGNEIVIKGMNMSDPTIVSSSTVRTTISSGWAIQDETLLNFTNTVTVDLDCAALVDTTTDGAHLGVFVNFEYLHTIEANLASVDMFHILSSGVVTDPDGRFSSNSHRILLGAINFTKSGSNVIAVSRYEPPTLLVSGVTKYVRGADPNNLNLPSLFEIAFREYREYLLKRDYLLAQ